MTTAIPPRLWEEIVARARCEIVSERGRSGGGASRQGADVALRAADGQERKCFLIWDEREADASRRESFDREAAILAALSGPLASAGVRVAPLIASFPSHFGLLSGYTEGAANFGAATDPSALARDFAGQLSALHRIPVDAGPLRALGDPSVPHSVRIRARIDDLRHENLAREPDPILQLVLNWLSDNVPDDRGSCVVVHGDAGPGNFIHADNRVVALLDWEFAHFGDPMEDLAQVWVRSLIQRFVPMREFFAYYEAAGGVPVDVRRVKYHRLYFQIGFSVPGHAAQYDPAAKTSATPGTSMMYATLHKRVMVTSLAEMVGVNLATPGLPAPGPSWRDRGFERALDDLRTDIVPGLSSEVALGKAKSLVRLVKFWRMRDRYGEIFDAAEQGEIRALLGGEHPDLRSARAAFAHAIAERRVKPLDALQVCHNRMTRETFVMADAMGALAHVDYEEGS